jgi:exodeoxyribonuclease-3
MSITLASWNVNSVRARLEQIKDWVHLRPVDILALQETKVVDADFPREIFGSLGYTIALSSGQPSYNGVALLSRCPLMGPLETVIDPFPLDCRYLSAEIPESFHLIDIYAPNGESLHSPKFSYKLTWYERLIAHLEHLLPNHPKIALVGDFNVAPTDLDVHDPETWQDSVLTDNRARDALRALERLGFQDAFRILHPTESVFSWWDYRGAALRRNEGLRIDLILLSRALAPHLRAAGIDTDIRHHVRPSDHVPVWAELEL